MLDVDAVTAWLAANVAGVTAPFEFHLIAGGRSNLTFEIGDAAGRRLVLRRPPLGNTLPSAHDMAREYRIMSSLAPTGVPVPVPLAFCAAGAGDGASFYIMEFVDGPILRDEAAVERHFGVDRRERLASSMIDVLADLHAVDPASVGLDTLARGGGYVERQLRTWQRQWERSRTRDLPAVDEVHRRLEAAVPTASRVSIVHGDYRIDNMIFGADASVRAILDWELCTLGDPLADVGLLAVYWGGLDGEGANALTSTPTLLAGFPPVQAILAQYAARTGADLSQIEFYVAFGYWKLACICEGVYARYRADAMGELPEDLSLDALADQVEGFAAAAAATLERGS